MIWIILAIGLLQHFLVRKDPLIVLSGGYTGPTIVHQRISASTFSNFVGVSYVPKRCCFCRTVRSSRPKQQTEESPHGVIYTMVIGSSSSLDVRV
jgi:hypothetical protein